MSDDLSILPLTPALLPAWEGLFGPSGACYGCWCTYFRMAPKLRQAATPDQRHDLMADRIRRGPPPGLVALRGDRAVGWMQIGTRADVPEWNKPLRVTAPLPDGPAEDPGVWAVSCFFFARSERGHGPSARMLAAGIAHARASGARLLEAAPMDRAKQSKSITLYVGSTSTSTFAGAGFAEVACRKPGRPLMRLVL